jgi:hypothetical protein
LVATSTRDRLVAARFHLSACGWALLRPTVTQIVFRAAVS